MTQPLLLTAAELVQLTGYRQHTRQVQWLSERLRLTPPRRADGLPVITRAQLEAALVGQPSQAINGPRWSRAA